MVVIDNPFAVLHRDLMRIQSQNDEILKRLGSTPPATPAEDTYLPAQESADFLGIALQTLYQNKTVKRTKRFGKLYFLKSDLVQYLQSGKEKTTR
jgi:hypothetical protein